MFAQFHCIQPVSAPEAGGADRSRRSKGPSIKPFTPVTPSYSKARRSWRLLITNRLTCPLRLLRYIARRLVKPRPSRLLPSGPPCPHSATELACPCFQEAKALSRFAPRGPRGDPAKTTLLSGTPPTQRFQSLPRVSATGGVRKCGPKIPAELDRRAGVGAI